MVEPSLDPTPVDAKLETPPTAPAGTGEVPPSPSILEQALAKTPVIESEKKPEGVAGPPGVFVERAAHGNSPGRRENG